MNNSVEKAKAGAISALQKAQNKKELNSAYIEIFGKKGILTKLAKTIPTLAVEKRPVFGRELNEIKELIEKELTLKKNSLLSKREDDGLDVSAPSRKLQSGNLHLVSQAIEEIVDIFKKLGFSPESYPEIDWDWYAFESLNMPKEHPARDDWETFFIKAPQNAKLGKQVLTPHTSNGQVREMQKRKPPIRILNIARCYRRQIDVSHTPMFHQFEGLLVDKNVSISQLKGTFDFFTTQFFGRKRITRLRPHHFRFTEPSFEVDVTCGVCLGKGCRLCKSGWLELGGAGMVHPNVLKAGNVNSEKYKGFAFGWGIERTIAMRTNLPDIRMLFTSDLRLNQQF